jgi:hypothetical protein
MKTSLRICLGSTILTGIILGVAFGPEAIGLVAFSQPIASSGTIIYGLKTYFEASFSYPGPSGSGYGLYEAWPSTEPAGYQNEKGTWHWVNCGPTDGTIWLVPDPVNPSTTCLQMLLSQSGDRPLPDDQQVKLYEVSYEESQLWESPYPTLKEAYWRMDYWFPSNFQVAYNSWRLIWQLCGEAGVYGNPAYTYAPQFALIFGDSSLLLQMEGFYYANGQDREFTLISNSALPKEQWVPIVVYMKQGSAFQAEDGTVAIWINGNKVFENHNLSTATVSGTPYEIWGIGNYGGPLEAQGQYINIKNVQVTSQFIG